MTRVLPRLAAALVVCLLEPLGAPAAEAVAYGSGDARPRGRGRGRGRGRAPPQAGDDPYAAYRSASGSMQQAIADSCSGVNPNDDESCDQFCSSEALVQEQQHVSAAVAAAKHAKLPEDADPLARSLLSKRRSVIVADVMEAMEAKEVEKSGCPPGQPCNCGCHCHGGLRKALVPKKKKLPVPTYPPPWWDTPCPPWGCACDFAVCVAGITHGVEAYRWIKDPDPIADVEIPGGLTHDNVPPMDGKFPEPPPPECPDGPVPDRPWYCP